MDLKNNLRYKLHSFLSIPTCTNSHSIDLHPTSLLTVGFANPPWLRLSERCQLFVQTFVLPIHEPTPFTYFHAILFDPASSNIMLLRRRRSSEIRYWKLASKFCDDGSLCQGTHWTFHSATIFSPSQRWCAYTGTIQSLETVRYHAPVITYIKFPAILH